MMPPAGAMQKLQSVKFFFLFFFAQFGLFLLLLESLYDKLLYSYIVVEPVATAGGRAERRGVVVLQGLRWSVLWSRGIYVVEGRWR